MDFASVTQQMMKRDPNKRVFVNRSLMMEKVKFFGFDMDYTLAVYNSPEYETLGFDLLKARLVDMGYPADIKEFEYDPTFPIRGLWFDNHFGTLLKVDGFGNILVCVRGFHFMKGHEIEEVYKSRFVQRDEKRFRIFNTLYELPLIYILACVIDYFCQHEGYTSAAKGVKKGDITMTFQSIYNDVGNAMEFVHRSDGPLKRETVKHVEKYVYKDDRLPVLLSRLRSHGKRVFLATNSDYNYSNKIMTYLFDTESNLQKKEWTSFFDYIIVDARKPLFFSTGTVLREVNRKTGQLHLGTFTGTIKSQAIYSGGSVDVFNEMMGAQSSEVVYVGDHIFGDILKSKKVRGWRTFLVVPELVQELTVWTEKKALYSKLSEYDHQIAEIYINMDSSDTVKPDISRIHQKIREVTYSMDQAYGVLGSVFRSGNRETFFASQVMRYADLYAASFMNMLYYPLIYCFRSPPMLMPHESTVDHQTNITNDSFRRIMAWRARASNEKNATEAEVSTSDNPVEFKRSDSHLQRLKCSSPKELNDVWDDFLENEARSPAEKRQKME